MSGSDPNTIGEGSRTIDAPSMGVARWWRWLGDELASNLAAERLRWPNWLPVFLGLLAVVYTGTDIRSLEERDLISDRPGVTADEAAFETGTRFPDVLRTIASAAELFDEVRYGHGTATSEDDASLRRLDSTLAGRSLLDAAKP